LGWRAVGLLVLVATALLSGCTQQSRPDPVVSSYPILHYFDGPLLAQLFKLSPDGTKLATLERQGAAINITVIDLQAGLKHATTSFSDDRITAFAWVNNERLVFYTGDVLELLAINYDGRQGRRLNDGGELLRIIHRLPENREAILTARYNPASGDSDVLTLDVYSARMLRVQRGPVADWPSTWLMDARGQVKGALVESDEETRLFSYSQPSGSWTDTGAQPRWSPAFRVLDAPLDGGLGIAVWQPPGAGASLNGFDIANGEVGPEITPGVGERCCELLVAAGSGQLLAAYEPQSQGTTARYMNPDFKAAASRLGSLVPGRQLTFVQVDDQGNNAVFTATSVLLDPDYYLYDFIAGEHRLLAKSPPVLTSLEEHQRMLDRNVHIVQQRSPAFDMRSTEFTRVGNRNVDPVASRSVLTGAQPQK
jgi:hypothetical protein